MNKEIKATFRIVTPMFLGDWEHGVGDGIRPPSVKGALRFWWRALNWKTAMEQSSNENEALKWLHKEEARLFGAAAGENGGGQGVFLLRVTKQPNISNSISDWPKNPLPIDGSTYMGFGLTKSGKQQNGNFVPHRDGICENESFSIELKFKNNSSDGDITSIKKSIETFGLIGGLGSRVRRGFGSVALVEMDGKKINQQYEETVKMLFGEFGAFGGTESYPPFTAFSSLCQKRIITIADNARSAHNKAGNEYKKYRGMESALRGEVKLPLGIPLQGVTKDKDERRASPLFFHIHQVENSFVALAYSMPAKFHPKHPNISHDEFYVLRDFFQRGTL